MAAALVCRLLSGYAKRPGRYVHQPRLKSEVPVLISRGRKLYARELYARKLYAGNSFLDTEIRRLRGSGLREMKYLCLDWKNQEGQNQVKAHCQMGRPGRGLQYQDKEEAGEDEKGRGQDRRKDTDRRKDKGRDKRKGRDEKKGRGYRRSMCCRGGSCRDGIYPCKDPGRALKASAKTYIWTELQNKKNVGTLGMARDSYILKEGNTYMIVKWVKNPNCVYVAYYDGAYNLVRNVSVPLELPKFGCFYTDGTNYYIVSGNDNQGHSDAVECFRVTKYDKNWNALGRCGLSACDTSVPFIWGSCRAEKFGNYLIVRTCHEMYSGHQANLTLSVNTTNMTMDSSVYNLGWERAGYVSHSLNQFMLNDNGKLVLLDLGDAYPRGIILNTVSNMTDGNLRTGAKTSAVIQNFKGDIGDAYVGADIGGMQLSSSSYLVAYRMIHEDTTEEFNKDGTANVYLAAVSRTTGKVTAKRQLSGYAPYTGDGASCPQIVPVGNDQYVVLWQPGGRNPYAGDQDTWNATGIVYYQRFDGNGTPLDAAKAVTGMNLCHDTPIYDNGKLIFFEMDAQGAVTFHEIRI